MSASAWVALRVQELEALRGEEVVGWQGVEMALLEKGPGGGPVFEVAGVKVTQLSVLWVLLADHRVVAIQTYQDDDEFGLNSKIVSSPALAGEDGIWRDAKLGDLPKALVSGVQICLNARGNISEVLLRFDCERETLLVAGEAYETVSGGLYFVRNDESLLLFRDPDEASTLEWR